MFIVYRVLKVMLKAVNSFHSCAKKPYRSMNAPLKRLWMSCALLVGSPMNWASIWTRWHTLRIPSGLFSLATQTVRRKHKSGGKQLPIHSLKWNPNDVLTTCKAICEVLVSGYTSYACADVACSNGTRTLKGKKLWRPKAADSVLSLRLGNWRIDRILHFYHVFVHFASYKDKSLLSEFFSRKVEQ